MPFGYIPTFRFFAAGEAKVVKDELEDDDQYYIEVRVPSRECVQFMVRERTEFVGNDVDAVHHVADWTVNYSSQGDVQAFENGKERKWVPDTEIGILLGGAIHGISEEEMTGKAACNVIFELWLQLGRAATGHVGQGLLSEAVAALPRQT